MRSLTWAQVGVQRRPDYFVLFYFIFYSTDVGGQKSREATLEPFLYYFMPSSFLVFLAYLLVPVLTRRTVELRHNIYIYVAISLIVRRLPSDTILMNTLNSIVSFPSFSPIFCLRT